MPSKPTAICILTRFYNQFWIDFLKSFTNYDVFLMVDDNVIIYEMSHETPIRIIQVDETLCIQHNYTHSSTAANMKDIIAWDKALYYFNHVETGYENVWFIEDDVFFVSEKTVLDIDQKYPKSDLISAFHDINHNGDASVGWNHWFNIIHRIEPPWAHSLVCACRLSRRLLKRVDEYLHDRHLIFIESLFNTLALHNSYEITTPSELSTIYYDHKWTEDQIVDPTRIYHPIKSLEMQKSLRQKLYTNKV